MRAKDEATPAIPSRAWDRANAALRRAILVVALLYLAVYAVVALCRLGHPFELEWMEGGIVDHVRKVAEHQPIYAKPSLPFVSFFYPPFYYWVGAAVSGVLGIGFLPLRLVSFLSSVGVLGFIFLLVRRETGALFPAVIAACLFAATYRQSGAWYDIARPDSLLLLLLLAGVYLVRFGTSTWSHLLAGTLLAAAFLTKQSAVVAAAPLLAHRVICDRGRPLSWLLVGVSGLVAGGAALFLDHASDGWFRYYCAWLPFVHPNQPILFGWFWTKDLVGPMGIACILSLFYLVAQAVGPFAWRRHFYGFLLAGTLVSSWLVRAKLWAEVNDLLPLYATVAILAGLGVDEVRRWIGADPDERGKAVACVLWLAVLGQFALLAYNPLALIPSERDREAGRAVVARIAAIEGDVLVPHHPYLAVLAGKSSFAHTLAMDNVLMDDPGRPGQDLVQEMARAIEERRFAAILVESDKRYAGTFSGGYELRETLLPDPNVFWTVTGYRVRPEFLFLPKAREADSP